MGIATTIRPEADEFAPYYGTYVGAVPDGDITRTLAQQGDAFLARLKQLTEEQAAVAYAPGKWTVKEVVCHITDAERIFAYRALRIARGDATPLASFDENAYAASCGANDRPLESLLDEFAAVRAATLALLRALPEAAWTRRGTASGKEVSVRGLAWIMTGHAIHHGTVLTDKYGVV
ncbi:MAG: DinB family protein [Gemmatimonadaceae bacterium]|nr:DinB family protein [Gemmatimonadaceae bacterium]